LQGKAQQHGIDEQGIAHQLAGYSIRIKARDSILTHSLPDDGGALLGRVLPVAIFHKGGSWRTVAIERHPGAPGAHPEHSLLACADDRVAAQNQIRGGCAYPCGAYFLRGGGHQYMAPGGAALLGQAGRVLGNNALALDVRGHPEQLPDGDDAGAAHPGHHNAISAARGQLGQDRLRKIAQGGRRGRLVFGLFLQLAALDRDEAGAKPLETAGVLVAGALVDDALAAKLCFQWLD